MAELLEAPSFANVGAGATAILDLPRNLTYERIMLKYAENGTAANAATMAASIESVRLKLGGVVHWELTGAQLLAINEFKGHGFVSGYLSLFFSDLLAHTIQSKDAMALGLANAASAQLEVKIKAGVTSPTLSAIFQARKLITGNTAVRKFRRFSANAAGAGDLVYNTLPRIDAIAGLYIFSSAVTAVELRRDQDTIFKGALADLEEFYETYGRVIPSNVFPVTLQNDNRLADAISMKVGDRPINNLDLIMTTSGAASIDIVAEFIGPQGR